jgi:integrase
MSIQKRGKKFQVNLYQGPSAKRRCKTFDSYRAAVEWESERRLERKMAGGDVTVAAFAATWLETHPRGKRSTEVHYQQAIKGFVHEFGRFRLCDLSRSQVRVWAIQHPSQMATARAMLGDAQRDDLLQGNPLAGMRLPSSRGRRDIQALSENDVQRLAECAVTVHGEYGRLIYAPMILLAAYTGLRPGELHGLRWEDVNLREETLRVERQYSPKANAFTSPKNGLARTVPLLPPAVQALRTIPRTSLREIFSTKQGRHFSGKVSSYYWMPVRAAYGDSTLDFYALRHACGSMLNRLGMSAPEIARVLGHTDGGQLALRTYVHVSEDEAVARAKQLYAVPRLRAVNE